MYVGLNFWVMAHIRGIQYASIDCVDLEIGLGLGLGFILYCRIWRPLASSPLYVPTALFFVKRRDVL